MRRVYKYQITLLADDFELDMPQGAVLLTFGAQNDCPCLWALVDPSAQTTVRRFRLAGTGHDLDYAPEQLTFIGTTLLRNDRLVLHLFEVTP